MCLAPISTKPAPSAAGSEESDRNTEILLALSHSFFFARFDSLPFHIHLRTPTHHNAQVAQALATRYSHTKPTSMLHFRFSIFDFAVSFLGQEKAMRMRSSTCKSLLFVRNVQRQKKINNITFNLFNYLYANTFLEILFILID
jgi:hypothetical protein